MFDLKPEVKKALIDMNFVKQFEKLSEDYAADVVPYDERIRGDDVNKITQIIKELGYKATYDKREKFFHIEVSHLDAPNCRFNVNLALDNGRVELTWEVYHNDKVRLGSPWTVYSRLLINPDYRIPFPAVLSYEELEEVLKINFDMFKQFQDLLITHYESEENE